MKIWIESYRKSEKQGENLITNLDKLVEFVVKRCKNNDISERVTDEEIKRINSLFNAMYAYVDCCPGISIDAARSGKEEISYLYEAVAYCLNMNLE